MFRADDFFDVKGIGVGLPLASFDTVWNAVEQLAQIIDDSLASQRTVLNSGALVEPGSVVCPDSTLRQGLHPGDTHLPAPAGC